MSLELRPLPLREANGFVREHHAHHGPARGCVFCVGCWEGARLVGVAIVGRPLSRLLQDGRTLEVTRLCTDRTPHAASKLLAACARTCAAIGCTRVLSYTLRDEEGTSYRAAGWRAVAASDGGRWDTPARPRQEPLAGLLGLQPKAPTGAKVRWEKELRP